MKLHLLGGTERTRAMRYGFRVMGLGMVSALALAVAGCSDDGGGGEPGSSGGAGGSGAAATGGAGASGGGSAGGTGGSTGGAASGGSAGTSTSGSSGGAAGGNSGGGGTAGGSGGSSGSGGAGEEPCTPASTDGIPYAGTCTYADTCSDQYDTSLGAALLEQACTSQSGTWSTTPCNPAEWDVLCTQEGFGGVYLQYMLAGGICVLGCEEAL